MDSAEASGDFYWRPGAFVHFDSGASNLLPGDVNANLDVVRFDRLAGTSTSGSPAPSGGPSTVGSASAGSQTLTADGRFAVFQSSATDYVLGDTNGLSDIFVRDRLTSTTVRASVSSTNAQGDNGCDTSSITTTGSSLPDLMVARMASEAPDISSLIEFASLRDT